ncbi:hypothetical protein L6654_14415 [Bradyrhizobium sp. WYCCWR 13023]|uniref:Uncharacterized protein n=1 Tax=Bradyrhizobium zhengyangense TaxID=2911009 RepID=A0A9X1UAA3_9BRAD|nr:hypothetical protein [Bradyrhizobium zhengyangense]MCG2627823.1 hypothetical protein [Bradyrhizobium zhengyangense]MCG2642641.1 hypothetical protein [Bradyrhizobium zhengyangense]MCG2669751.1 hypothetical protein [Bradyrhizobium zhengyangense]
MREASSNLRRAGSRVLAVMLLAAATALAGCAGGNAPANSYAMAAPSAGSGATVAFESIDGPPPQVFDRMVGVLDTESKLRSLSIVSREGTAAYRVRSYLSAQIVRGKTVIAWVWDVYDANQQRALRLSGEEPTAAKGGKDPWAAADDLVLRRIAQAGFSGLSNMINGTPDAPGSVPGLRGPAVASVTPEAPAPDMPVTALGYAQR